MKQLFLGIRKQDRLVIMDKMERYAETSELILTLHFIFINTRFVGVCLQPQVEY